MGPIGEYAGLSVTPPGKAGRLHLPGSVVATDLDTEDGGTDANKRDETRQGGRLGLADLQK
jgi:hypothetical protein